LNLSGQKTLFIFDDMNKNVYLSSRNIQRVQVMAASQLNTYDILNAKKLVLVEGAIANIEKMLN
jgi:large subunit ribosomal protein L4